MSESSEFPPAVSRTTPAKSRPVRTRTEHTRSLEDANKYKALRTLTELGFLTPLSQIETFHGRVGNEAESWKVKPTFDNKKNATGNRNVNARSTLYSADLQTAWDFAIQREATILAKLLDVKIKNYTPEQRREWLERLNQDRNRKGLEAVNENYLGVDFIRSTEAYRLLEGFTETQKQKLREQSAQQLRTEIHQIFSSDIDATVIDSNFDVKNLTEVQKKKFQDALTAITIPNTEGTPVDFNYRNAVTSFDKTIAKLQKNFILSKEINDIAIAAGISEEAALHFSAGYNARQIAITNPQSLVRSLLSNQAEIITGTFDVNGTKEEAPVSMEYAEMFFKNAHIVGAKQLLYSATLERDITSYSFFDLQKIGTRGQIEIQKQNVAILLGGLTEELEQAQQPAINTENKELLEILSDAHAKPEQLVKAAKQIPGYKEIFESKVGNWEGFTLEEHTETVLRNFEENFADSIPVEMLKTLRLAILVHDIGKPLAVAKGEKYKQKEYNSAQANDFLTKVGYNRHIKSLIISMIGEGLEIAYRIQVRKIPEAVLEMRTFAGEAIKWYLDSQSATEKQILAFEQMCKILQTCDGGAYTSMAITRRGGKGHFRNYPSFNESFLPPIGLGKRDIKYQ